MDRLWSLKIMALLAFVQGIFGLARAYDWVQIGGNLFRQGLLLLPLVGTLAIMRGLFIFAVALLYVLFALGALLARGWAWWPGLTAAIINLLLVLGAVTQGLSLLGAIAWSVIPAILIIYFFSQKKSHPLSA